MAAIHDKVSKQVSDAYYGEGAVIGDGTFLKMLMEFFAKFIGNCPLGAKRAHAMANGGKLRQMIARERLEYAAWFWTGGDSDEAKKITEVGMTVAQASTEKEFVDFAKP